MYHHELESHAKRYGLLFSRSRSQKGLMWSKYDSLYYIFWTADPFATKLCLIVHYLKPECSMKKLDCCVQGRGHSKISKCQGMLIYSIFLIAEPFTTKLSMVMCHHEPDCPSKRLLSSRSRSQQKIIKSEYGFLIDLNCWTYCNWTLFWWLSVISWIVFWKDWMALLWSRSRT